MNIHFSAAIDGDKKSYARIINFLESKTDNKLLTRHALERKMSDIRKETEAESELAAKRIERWIKKADLMIFEVTKSDVSIGYEVANSLNSMKPVIVLYKEGFGAQPHGLKGIKSDKLQVIGYSDDTLQEVLSIALDNAQDSLDVRFNFFIPPSISSYLDWMAKYKKIPRSVYLRNLIQSDMNANQEYQDEIADDIFEQQ